jgi:hypothetical protein
MFDFRTTGRVAISNASSDFISMDTIHNDKTIFVHKLC